MTFRAFDGWERKIVEEVIRNFHYTKSVPSGKSYYVGIRAAIVVWSIPANPYIARFLLPEGGKVWELSRLWAPDGHEKNLLSFAISKAVDYLKTVESVDLVVSYADPAQGHSGGVYRAASWMPHGVSDESRGYRKLGGGPPVSRRKFHSGGGCMTKAEILAAGYEEIKTPGKIRFVRALTKSAKQQLSKGAPA